MLCGSSTTCCPYEPDSAGNATVAPGEEFTTAAHGPTWVCRVGVRDRFSRYCGSYDYLIRQQGLDVDSIAGKVSGFLASANPMCLAFAA